MKALKSLAVVAVALAGPGTSFATEVKAPIDTVFAQGPANPYGNFLQVSRT